MKTSVFAELYTNHVVSNAKKAQSCEQQDKEKDLTLLWFLASD